MTLEIAKTCTFAGSSWKTRLHFAKTIDFQAGPCNKMSTEVNKTLLIDKRTMEFRIGIITITYRAYYLVFVYQL